MMTPLLMIDVSSTSSTTNNHYEIHKESDPSKKPNYHLYVYSQPNGKMTYVARATSPKNIVNKLARRETIDKNKVLNSLNRAESNLSKSDKTIDVKPCEKNSVTTNENKSMNEKDTIQALHNEIELLQHESAKLKRECEELSQLVFRLLKEKYKIND